MKKSFVLLLVCIILVSCVFAACNNKKNNDDENTSSSEGLNDTDTEFGIEEVEVTDENGKAVTDANGNKVTTQVAVQYSKDKKGKTIGKVLDANGNPVKDNKGKDVTVKVKDDEKTPTKNHNMTTEDAELTVTQAPDPTGTTNEKVPMTQEKNTTKFDDTKDEDIVPKTSDKGKQVNFSPEDQSIIKSMLEVPYLYLSSYENSDGVPLDIAAHTAVWMIEHEGGVQNVYPSSPVVLNLFKYYGQTVVDFKTKCNEFASDAGAPITWNKADDTFEISGFTSKKQTVSIEKIEDMGNNNYYKVTASVSGCNKKKVVAIIQKNRLDATLGFSIKALKWS